MAVAAPRVRHFSASITGNFASGPASSPRPHLSDRPHHSRVIAHSHGIGPNLGQARRVRYDGPNHGDQTGTQQGSSGDQGGSCHGLRNARGVCDRLRVRQHQQGGQGAVHVSPGISKSIARLEGELGCPLFERTHQGLDPTRDARALYVRVRDLMDTCEQIRSRSG